MKWLSVIHTSVFVFLIFSLLITIYDVSSPTGNIVARGGQITNISLQTTDAADYWSIVYGEINPVGYNDYNFTSGAVRNINISSTEALENTTIIIATTSSSLNISNILPAPLAFVDGLIGVGPANIQSATSVFAYTDNITLGSLDYEAPYALTNISNATIRSYLFVENSEVVILSPFSNQTASDNISIHFQLLLPLINTTTRYYFSTLNTSAFSNATTCTINNQIDAVLLDDNSSINISWDTVAGAVHYNLFYADGLDPINNTLVLNQSVNTITNTYYVDSSPSDERYYAVQAQLNGRTCLSNNTAATYLINLTTPANLISFPINFTNNSIENIIRPINNSLVALNEFDNAARSFNFFILFAGSIFKNFDTIEVGKAYWASVNTSTQLRVAGKVQESINEPIFDRENLIGPPFIQGNNSVAYVLRSIDGNYTAVNEYDNIAKSYNFYIVFNGSVFQNFNTIKPTYGYWISADENETLII